MSTESADLVSRRAPRINAANVFEAADALVRDGQRPTIDRIRVRLGRGSPNTIAEHLETWWQELAKRLHATPGTALPGVPDAVVNVLGELWEISLGAGKEAVQTALNAREAALAARETQLEERTDALEQREAFCGARLEAQDEALELARAQLAEANERARSLETALATRATEVESLREQAAALEREMQGARRAVTSATAAHTAERDRLNERFDREQTRWSEEVDRLRQAAKEDKRVLKERGKELALAEAQIKQLQLAVERLGAALEAAEKVRDQLLAKMPTTAKTRREPGRVGSKRRGKRHARSD